MNRMKPQRYHYEILPSIQMDQKYFTKISLVTMVGDSARWAGVENEKSQAREPCVRRTHLLVLVLVWHKQAGEKYAILNKLNIVYFIHNAHRHTHTHTHPHTHGMLLIRYFSRASIFEKLSNSPKPCIYLFLPSCSCAINQFAKLVWPAARHPPPPYYVSEFDKKKEASVIESGTEGKGERKHS